MPGRNTTTWPNANDPTKPTKRGQLMNSDLASSNGNCLINQWQRENKRRADASSPNRPFSIVCLSGVRQRGTNRIELFGVRFRRRTPIVEIFNYWKCLNFCATWGSEGHGEDSKVCSSTVSRTILRITQNCVQKSRYEVPGTVPYVQTTVQKYAAVIENVQYLLSGERKKHKNKSFFLLHITSTKRAK